MKANEAPEKLYIALNELTEDERTFVLDHRVDYPICTEYIHTDAFIEKAIKFFAPHIQDNSGGYDRANVIKDFRKYIKGE